MRVAATPYHIVAIVAIVAIVRAVTTIADPNHVANTAFPAARLGMTKQRTKPGTHRLREGSEARRPA